MVDKRKEKAKKQLQRLVNEKNSQELMKQQEFIQKQKEYKDTVLARLYKGAELKEMRAQLEKGPIKMQWYGMTYPKDLLALEHDIVQSTYKELIIKEEQLKAFLVGSGLTLKQLQETLDNGTIIKEIPTMEEQKQTNNRKV